MYIPADKMVEARSRVDRKADNHQLLLLEEKDVVSSVATLLSDLCGPGEWMPMEKLHAEVSSNVVYFSWFRICRLWSHLLILLNMCYQLWVKIHGAYPVGHTFVVASIMICWYKTEILATLFFIQNGQRWGLAISPIVCVSDKMLSGNRVEKDLAATFWVEHDGSRISLPTEHLQSLGLHNIFALDLR